MRIIRGLWQFQAFNAIDNLQKTYGSTVVWGHDAMEIIRVRCVADEVTLMPQTVHLSCVMTDDGVWRRPSDMRSLDELRKELLDKLKAETGED